MTGRPGQPAPSVVCDRLTKRYGEVTAIEDVSFEVRPGRVLGLLGPNGAGKTTTLRAVLGLATPTSGSATVLGAPYGQLPRASHRVGVAIDGMGHLPGVSGRRELRIWAAMLGVPRTRIAEVMRLVDLPVNARRATTTYSTGMRQRLALATALLADPEVLILDEPASGLDPVGIRWLRELLRDQAGRGRTVVISSHLLAEVAQTVDDVVILRQRVRYAGPIEELTDHGQHRLEDRFFELIGPVATGGSARQEAADG